MNNESLLVQWTMTRLKTYLSFYRTDNTTCIQDDDDHRVNTEVEVSDRIVDTSLTRREKWTLLLRARSLTSGFGERLAARCPMGESGEKATALGWGRPLSALAVVGDILLHRSKYTKETFY